MTPLRALVTIAFVVLGVLRLPVAAQAQDGLSAAYPTDAAPDFVALGFGALPRYIGSDEYFFGAAPAARLTRGNRFIALNGNFVNANVLEHPNLRIGPVVRLRFGRKTDNIDDSVMATLPEIDHTIELGGFVNWTQIDTQDPRDRWQIGIDVTSDVMGTHNGTVASVFARQFFGIGQFAIGGLGVAATYGDSNYMNTFFEVGQGELLRAYEPGDGIRDVRFQAGVLQPLSTRWAVGAGFQYMRLLDVAADSPIVDERGSEDQWLVGIGLVRIFGFD